MNAQTVTPDVEGFVAIVDHFAAQAGLAGYSDLTRENGRLSRLAAERYAMLTDMAEDIVAAALNLTEGGQTNVEAAEVQIRAAALRLQLALQQSDARADLGPLPENVSVLALARAARRHRVPAPAA